MDSMDTVFQALSSETRRRILDILRDSPGISVGEVAEHFAMTRIGVMKHLAVLEEAELVLSEKVGRRRELYFNVAPIQLIYDRWTSQYSKLWARDLARLKFNVENRMGEDPE